METEQSATDISRFAPPDEPVEQAATDPTTPDDVTPTAEPAQLSPRDSMGDLDIESALAAVTTLNELVSDEYESVSDEWSQDGERFSVADTATAEANQPANAPRPDFPRVVFAGHRALSRGQVASVVPGLLLLLVGVALTFFTDELLFNPWLAMLGSLALIGLALYVRWISAFQDSRGTFFVATTFVLIAASLVALLAPLPLNLVNAYPLLLSAIGGAMLLGAALQPEYRRAALLGFMLLILGFVGASMTLGYWPNSVLRILAQYGVVLLPFIGLMLLTPVLRRR